MAAKLGSIEVADATSPPSRPVVVEPPGEFDLEFRNEVTELVHQILRQSYVTQRDSTRYEAQRWGLTLEQLVAAAVSHHVMKKVDTEYV